MLVTLIQKRGLRQLRAILSCFRGNRGNYWKDRLWKVYCNWALHKLMDPTSGEVKFGGVGLKEQSLDEFKRKTGYVPQDVFLFSDTIESNISFGSTDLNREEAEAIEEVAKMSAVHEDIVGLENGYKTILGERGVNLSGGQKQRISIARALLRKPRILILDDCLSAVDTKTEKHIIKSLEDLQKENPFDFYSYG